MSMSTLYIRHLDDIVLIVMTYTSKIPFYTTFFILLILLTGCGPVPDTSQASEANSLDTVQQEVERYFGFAKDSIEYIEGTIKPNTYMSSLLGEFGVPYKTIHQLSEKAKSIFPLRQIRSGKPYAIISTDSCFTPEYFVYKPSVFRHITFDLRDTTDVHIIEYPIDTVRKSAAGVINGSLWVTMQEQGLSPVLIDRMEDALAWSVDFYHIQNGDKFKVIYDQYYIGDDYAGIGKLHGAVYESNGKEFYSIHFKGDKYDGYFDEKGRPMKRAFLKSPVRYGRISSRFNRRRFHPVLKRHKAHLGTDYAAPTGTPIIAVADGTVTKVSQTRNNGKYVKIKHDKMYSTQYLHMSRHVKGMRAGDKVKQGETIGYVGQTGLATGPHVCFRFWKNGRQVNHLRENLPPPQPMDPVQLPAYNKVRDEIKGKLDAMSYPRLFDAPVLDSTAAPSTDSIL